MGLKDMVEGWILKVALKKGVKAIVSVLLSAIASAKVAPILTQAGVTIDPVQLEVGLLAAGTGAITMALNWLKIKTSLGQKFL